MPGKITILHVMGPSKGGMRTHLVNLMDGADSATFDIVVACPDDPVISECINRRCGTHEPFTVPDRVSPATDAARVVALGRLIRRVRPEICHFHGFKAAALGRAAVRLLGSVRTPSRRSVRSERARDTERPAIVYTVHNSVLARTRGTPQGRVFAYVERALAPVTDRVIAVSRALRDEYASIPGLGPEKVRHVPNGVPLLRFANGQGRGLRTREQTTLARAELGCSEHSFVVGAVARLIPSKGLGVLLRALARLRDWGLRPEVLIAGDGPARPELERLAAFLGVAGQVRFLGFIEDVVPLYAAIDVFVLPSLSEGMPLSLLEAMAAGVPVVVSRTPGIEEVVGPGMGWLAAPGDDLAIAACLKHCLLHPLEAERAAACARDEARRKFSRETMIKGTHQVYIEALAARGAVARC